MYDVSTDWHTTIEPFYFLTGRLLSLLAILMLLLFMAIKILRVKKEKYQGPINIVNLVFCIISSAMLASYVSEFIIACHYGYVHEQIAFLNRSGGSYWLLYLGLMWLPLLLTQLLWRKKNRININLALFITIMFNLHLWFERIYIVIVSLIRN